MSLSPSPPFSASQQAGRGLMNNIRTICAEQKRCDVHKFDNQVNAVVGAHVKEYRNKWQIAAVQSQLG